MSDLESMEKAAGIVLSAATGDGLGASLQGWGLIKLLVKRYFPGADQLFQAAVEEEIREAVFRRVPQLEANVRKLRDQSPGEPTPSSVLAVFDAFTQAYSHAEKSKRDLLLNALANSFDPEIYEQALSRRLFGILDQLDYGDLYFLKNLACGDASPRCWNKPAEMDFIHGTQLVENGLVHREVLSRSIPGDDQAVVTGLGHRMVRFIQAHAKSA